MLRFFVKRKGNNSLEWLIIHAQVLGVLFNIINTICHNNNHKNTIRITIISIQFIICSTNIKLFIIKWESYNINQFTRILLSKI